MADIDPKNLPEAKCIIEETGPVGPEVKDARKGDFMITVRIPEQYYDAPDDGKKKKKGAEEEGKDEQNDPGDEPIIALLVSPASAVGEIKENLFIQQPRLLVEMISLFYIDSEPPEEEGGEPVKGEERKIGEDDVDIDDGAILVHGDEKTLKEEKVRTHTHTHRSSTSHPTPRSPRKRSPKRRRRKKKRRRRKARC